MVGILLAIPAAVEWLEHYKIFEKLKNKDIKSVWKLFYSKGLWIFLMLLGTGIYLLCNYKVTGNCFKFLEYQAKYWNNGSCYFGSGIAKMFTNAKTVTYIKQFFDFENIDEKIVVVKEGETFSTGKHNFAFVLAPMVHWPEVMVSFDTTTGTLFSADAFGTFGAMNGNIFADQVDFEKEWLDDARRYYTNIVGKYSPQVKSLLEKASTLDIKMICPLHGPIWRENIGWYVDKYMKWATYTPEDKAVVIAYGSVYGNTENAMTILACKLGDLGVRNIKMYDVSNTHPSQLVSEAFRASNLVFAAITYNNGIFTNMKNVLEDLKNHNIQNRTVALVENGTWGPLANKQMKEIVEGMKNMTILNETVTIKSSLKESQMDALDSMAKAIYESMK